MKPGLVLTVNPAITYGVFERVKGLVLAREGRVGGRLSVGESFWIGVASKTLATVVTYPYIFVSPGRSGGRSCQTTSIVDKVEFETDETGKSPTTSQII